MKAAGRGGGGGGVRLAASGEGTKRRRGKQALPTHAPQLWLKVLTTRKRHNVQGEANEALDILECFFLFFFFSPLFPFFKGAREEESGHWVESLQEAGSKEGRDSRKNQQGEGERQRKREIK